MYPRDGYFLMLSHFLFRLYINHMLWQFLFPQLSTFILFCRLVGPKYSGEEAEPTYNVAEPTYNVDEPTEIEEDPSYDYEQRQIEIEDLLEDNYDIIDLGGRSDGIAQ